MVSYCLTVPIGSALTMQAGSAAQVLLAWEDSERIHRGLTNARFTAAQLAAVRRRGWAQSMGEREAGVASVSAPDVPLESQSKQGANESGSHVTERGASANVQAGPFLRGMWPSHRRSLR